MINDELQQGSAGISLYIDIFQQRHSSLVIIDAQPVCIAIALSVLSSYLYGRSFQLYEFIIIIFVIFLFLYPR